MPNVSQTASLVEKDAGEKLMEESSERKGLYPKVTVRLNGELGAIVDDLQTITHAQTQSDVVKRALVVYHTIVKQKLAGNEPFIEKKEGDLIKKVPIFL